MAVLIDGVIRGEPRTGRDRVTSPALRMWGCPCSVSPWEAREEGEAVFFLVVPSFAERTPFRPQGGGCGDSVVMREEGPHAPPPMPVLPEGRERTVVRWFNLKHKLSKRRPGTSLEARSLRLRVSAAGRVGSIPGLGTKIPPATRCGHNREREREREPSAVERIEEVYRGQSWLGWRGWAVRGSPQGG